VEEDAALAAEPSDLRHPLHGTYLVVGHHDADDRGVRPDGAREIVWIQESVLVHGEARQLEAKQVAQLFDRATDGMVLDGRCDDMAAASHLAGGPRRAAQGEIVGLSARRDEDDL